MRQYQSDAPRAACALAALAITTITFSLFVVVPAEVESGVPESATIEAQQAVVAVVASLADH